MQARAPLGVPRARTLRAPALGHMHAPASAHTDFTNLLSPVQLQELAEADALKEQIQGVQVRGQVARAAKATPLPSCRTPPVGLQQPATGRRRGGAACTAPPRA